MTSDAFCAVMPQAWVVVCLRSEIGSQAMRSSCAKMSPALRPPGESPGCTAQAGALLAGLMQQLSQRLFAALALRKRAAIVAAAAGSPLLATAVHATAFQIVNERISDLLLPGKASRQGQQGDEPPRC